MSARFPRWFRAKGDRESPRQTPDSHGYAPTPARNHREPLTPVASKTIHQRALPAKQHNQCSDGYARGPRVSTLQPIHRTLHALGAPEIAACLSWPLFLRQAEATPSAKSFTSPAAQEPNVPRRDQYLDGSDQAEDFVRSDRVSGLSIASA